MLYHQNIFAVVHAGSIRRARSQSFSPATSAFDCFQKPTSPRSRSYQPLPTMP